MLSDTEIEGMRMAFEAFARKPSGQVNPRELWHAMHHVGLGSELEAAYLQALLKPLVELDVEWITFEEFVHMVRRRLGNEQTPEGLRCLYDLLDRKKKGYIDAEDLRAIALVAGERAKFTVHEFRALLVALNDRKDYRLTFEDFSSALMQLDRH